MKSLITIVIVLFSLLMGCAKHSEQEQDSHSGEIERTFVEPQKILWFSDNEQVYDMEYLLRKGIHQASLNNDSVCVMKNGDANASILLDFGKELHGGLEIVTGMWPSGKSVEVRIRFGESVSETMADVGGEGGATNDHAIRDWTVKLPWLGKTEIGNTGFRFVRIDLIGEDAELHLKEVNAISVMMDIPYLGSFTSSDERLNKIWETGAHTVHLNMQEYLWDGIKRDRLVWVGDLHPEVMTILSVFGANEVVTKSLDHIAEITHADEWMNGISSYSMWWLLIQHQYYMNTGNIDYLSKNKMRIYSLLSKLEGYISPEGREMLDGMRFIDWPTSEDTIAIHAGLQSMMVMTFDAGAAMANIFDDPTQAEHYTNVSHLLKKHVPDFPTRKSPGALMALSGLADPQMVNDELLRVDGVNDLSTFYGYYVLNAMALANNHGEAIDFIREYWGAMIDLGATSFWEDFNIKWIQNAERIDVLPSKEKIDIHATYGDYCYKGLRHSLCHGWASGPTAWLSQYVLGVEVVEPGFKKVKITPHLGDLKWVEGTFPTPMGIIEVRHERQADGSIKSRIKTPKGVGIVN